MSNPPQLQKRLGGQAAGTGGESPLKASTGEPELALKILQLKGLLNRLRKYLGNEALEPRLMDLACKINATFLALPLPATLVAFLEQEVQKDARKYKSKSAFSFYEVGFPDDERLNEELHLQRVTSNKWQLHNYNVVKCEDRDEIEPIITHLENGLNLLHDLIERDVLPRRFVLNPVFEDTYGARA